MVTRDSFLNWLEDPVTQLLRKKLKEDVEQYKTMLMYCSQEDLHKLQAHCDAAIKIVELEFEDLTHE